MEHFRCIYKSPLISFSIWRKAEADNPILQMGTKAQRGKNNFPRWHRAQTKVFFQFQIFPVLSTPSSYLLKLNIPICLVRPPILTDTYEFWEAPGRVAKFDQ